MATLDHGNIEIPKPVDSAGELVACDISQLEQLFSAAEDNAEALSALQDELRYRQSPMALALLNRIHNVLERRASS